MIVNSFENTKTHSNYFVFTNSIPLSSICISISNLLVIVRKNTTTSTRKNVYVRLFLVVVLFDVYLFSHLSRLEDAAHEGPLQHRLVFKDRYSNGHLKKKHGGRGEGEKKTKKKKRDDGCYVLVNVRRATRYAKGVANVECTPFVCCAHKLLLLCMRTVFFLLLLLLSLSTIFFLLLLLIFR